MTEQQGVKMKRSRSEVTEKDCETAPVLILHCPLSLEMLVSLCAHITRLTFPLIFSCEEFPWVTLFKLAGTISNFNVGLLLSGFKSKKCQISPCNFTNVFSACLSHATVVLKIQAAVCTDLFLLFFNDLKRFSDLWLDIRRQECDADSTLAVQKLGQA